MRNSSFLLSLLICGLLALASCGGPEQQTAETETEDGMTTENVADAEASDASTDAAETDAGSYETAESETGEAESGGAAPAGPGPAIAFKDKNNFHDFGIVTHGDIKTHKFEFTNTGTEPLKIKTAKGSCSCINPIDWTKEAVPSGETGYVLAEFNSNGKYGLNRKEITVITNAKPPKTVLKIKAEVPKD